MSITVTTEDVKYSGQKTIRLEIEGLQKLSDSLNDSFSNAVDAMFLSAGRVVLTGIGKSAHVAGKISATLASTGTPAYFVHASEASHGDLGMITTDDVVIALSNSGETRELTDLVQYCVRFSITLIAITANKSSMLGASSTVCLTIPKAPEACSETSAPTTSTTMMMVLGDALAVSLLERRGFKATDFKLFHPGGSLGAALMKASDAMHTGENIPTVLLSTTMSEALLQMTSKGFGCTGVVDEDGRLIGIITDGDLRRHMDSGIINMTAEEVMTTGPRMVRPDILLSDVLRIMTSKTQKVTSVFVIENERPIGIIHIHDCLRAGLA